MPELQVGQLSHDEVLALGAVQAGAVLPKGLASLELLATLGALVLVDRHLFKLLPFCLVQLGALAYGLSSYSSRQTFPALLLHRQEGLALLLVHLRYPDLGFCT